MQEIQILHTKYRQATSDAMLPYKYIPQSIREISADIEKIEKIAAENDDTKVLRLSVWPFEDKIEYHP